MHNMNKRSLLLFAAGLTLSVPLAASTASASLCTMNGGLLDATGNPITVNTPYSPKMTCMQGGACHSGAEYASGNLIDVHKTQGVLDVDGGIHWQSYVVKAHDHGAVRGRHMQEGRNEDYSIAMKTTFKDAFFTSSPGMYGKY